MAANKAFFFGETSFKISPDYCKFLKIIGLTFALFSLCRTR